MSKRRWVNLIVAAKSLMARVTPMAEFCHRCGKTQRLVWRAPDRIWERHRNDFNVLCPECFGVLVNANGYALRWTPTFRDGITVWVPQEVTQW